MDKKEFIIDLIEENDNLSRGIVTRNRFIWTLLSYSAIASFFLFSSFDIRSCFGSSFYKEGRFQKHFRDYSVKIWEDAIGSHIRVSDEYPMPDGQHIEATDFNEDFIYDNIRLYGVRRNSSMIDYANQDSLDMITESILGKSLPRSFYR